MAKKIKVYFLPVEGQGVIKEIDNTLESFQAEVGGYIEILPLDREGEIDIVCNECGKIDGLVLNRAWIDNEKIIEIIAGNCFIVRHNEDGNSTSIQESDVKKVNSILKRIMAFEGKIFVLEGEDGDVRVRGI